MMSDPNNFLGNWKYGSGRDPCSWRGVSCSNDGRVIGLDLRNGGLTDRSGSIVIREVWAQNLESEFELISGIVEDFPLISMDTEFPCVIFKAEPAVFRSGERWVGRCRRWRRSNYFPMKLYQTVVTVSGGGSLVYELEVDAKLDYLLCFHFCEIGSKVKKTGQRVFDLVVNDNNVSRVAEDPYLLLDTSVTVSRLPPGTVLLASRGLCGGALFAPWMRSSRSC